MENISPAPNTGNSNVQNALDIAIPASQNFDSNKTSETIGSRVTKSQKDEIDAKAKKAGLPTAHWIMKQLRKADLLDELIKALV